MKGKAVFARARDAQPGLRELPGGPVRVAQPSRIDDIREARFDAYRARTDGQATEPIGGRATGRAGGRATEPIGGRATGSAGGQASGPETDQATVQAGGQFQGLAETARAAFPASRDPEEGWRALNDAAAAYRERLAASRSAAKPAAADVNQRGMAAVREALRHRP
jgi:hypothetical protein